MLSLSQTRCLLAVYSVSELYTRASSKAVCKLLGISKPSVHNALVALEEKGLIEKKPYAAATLTPEGLALARELDSRREKLTMVFSKQYGLSMDQSDLAAMQLISCLNEDSLVKLGCADSPECSEMIAEQA